MKVTFKFIIGLILALSLTSPAVADKTPLLTAGNANQLNSTTTEYIIISGGAAIAWNATESVASTVSPTAGTIDKLYVELNGVAGAGNSYVFTVRKDSADTSLTCTISGNTDITCNDTSNSFTVSAGDELSFQAVPISSPTARFMNGASVLFTGDVNGETVLMGHGSTFDMDFDATIFWALQGYRADDGTGSFLFHSVPTPGDFKKLYAVANTAPGAGNSYIFTIQKDDVDTAVTCTISGTATTCNDTSNSVSFVIDEQISLATVAISTPTSSTGFWGAVFVADTAGEAVLYSGAHHTLETTLNEYLPVMGGFQATAIDGQTRVQEAQAFTAKHMRISITVAPGSGNSHTWTLRDEQSDTGLSCVISGASATTCDDTTDAVFDPGDDIVMQDTPASRPDASQLKFQSVLVYITPPVTSVTKIYGATLQGATIN